MNQIPTVVAVTGASGQIGSRLLKNLEDDSSILRTLAIDTRPVAVPFNNASLQRLNITQPLDSTFLQSRVNIVVHLAFESEFRQDRDSINGAHVSNRLGMKSVLNACKAAGIKKIIYLSSHTVYGARKNNQIPITEKMDPMPQKNFQQCYDRIICERMLMEFAEENPESHITILRPAEIMGPGADNYLIRAFMSRLFFSSRVTNPNFQFVHEDDVAKIIHQFIREPTSSGIFNVAGDGVVSYQRLARLFDKHPIKLPSPIAHTITKFIKRFGASQGNFPSGALDFIKHPTILDTQKLQEYCGFRFFYTSEESLMTYVKSR
jgi:UDP-glucose 4-epimerase